MPDKINVLLVENDLDFVFLIRKMIEKDETLHFVAFADNAVAGVELAKELQPDIVLMDLNLSKSNLDGIEAAKEIRLTTDAKVLFLTSFEQPEIIISASKKAFASGYIFKSQSQTLTDTISKTAAGRTPQEQFIKELILQDLTPAERSVFALMLGKEVDSHSALKTIANQKTSIFKKVGLRNSSELLHIFMGW